MVDELRTGQPPRRRFQLLPTRLLRNRFARDVSLLAGGTAIGQALLILASPLLTRMYGPSDFGVFSVFSSIVSVPMGVASLKYELAIPLAEDDESAANILGLATLLVPATTILIGAILFLVGHRIIEATNTPALARYLWLMPASLLGAGLSQVFTYWAIRRKSFRPIAGSRVVQSLGQILTQLLFGFLGLPAGLIVGDAVGRVFGATSLAATSLTGDRRHLRRISSSGMAAGARRFRRFPIFASGSVLLNSAGLYLPPLLFAGFYGDRVAGWFALSQRIISIPMVLIGTGIAQVYVSEAASRVRGDLSSLKSLHFKTGRTLLGVMTAPLLLLAVAGPWIFAFVFGPVWREAGEYVRLLTVMSILQFVVVPLSHTLNLLERQHWQFAWDAGRLLLVVGSLTFAHSAGASARGAVLTFGGTMAIAYLALLALNLAALARVRAQ